MQGTIDGEGAGELEDGGGGGGVLLGGGGDAELEPAGADVLSLVSIICQTALFPVPSSVMILPPYFMSGDPLVGGHPFKTLPNALRQVDELATKVSVPGTSETLKYMMMPGK